MAANSSAVPDENGNFSDWLELYNGTGHDLNLEGVMLTNRTDRITFPFPAYVLKAGGYVLVFADKSYQLDPAKPFHGKFKISSAGDHLYLYDPNMYLIDEVVTPTMDTAYMFWSLTMGILLGAGLHLVALIVVLCISVLMFVLTFAKFSNPNAYLLVVHYDEFCEQSITAELRRSVKNYKLRSKSLTRAGAEMTYEVRLNERHEIVTRMLDIEGVHDATLVACQSEVGA